VTESQPTVRRAAFGDEPVLRALRLEALAESPEAFSSTLERERARTTDDWRRWLSPPGVTLLLEERGEARGLVAGTRHAEEPGVAYLMAMWVDPRLRGSGAADLLIRRHLEWADEAGARLVRLGVMDANVRARRAYERHGFRLSGTRTQQRDGRVELQMERSLSAHGSEAR
jgi:ribosomal protein S18 acetylase RimI-like enzyme